MAGAGAAVLGIDLGEKALGVARLHKLESGATVDYRLVAAEALAAETPGAFDVVTCMELLEHVPDPASIVAACATLAKPGGTVVVLDDQPQSEVVRCSRSSAPNTCCRLLPRGTHDYAKFLTPAELAAFARRAGLAPVDDRSA